MSKKNQDDPFVILTFASNTCYPDLVTKLKGVDVNFEKKEWTFENRTYKFAQSRYIDWGCQYGPISVYNKQDTAHLKSMLSAWQSQKSLVHSSFDD
jgi:hypothetical protein